MFRHRGAVGDGNQTLGSYEVHVGGRGHGAGDGTPGGAAKLVGVCGASARPTLAADDEPGAARPRGRGRGSSRLAGAPRRPQPLIFYVTGCASARSSRGRLRRCRRRPARRPARSPDGRALLLRRLLGEMPHVAVASLLDCKRVRVAGKDNCQAGALPRPPLRPAHAPGHQPSTRKRGAGAERDAALRRHFFPRPPTATEPLVLPRRAAPAFSSSVTISQNPITSQSRPPPIGQWGG